MPMFSGLYGDLPSAKDDDKKKESWAGSGLLAPTKRPAFAPPPSVLRAAAGGRGRGREGPGPVAPGRGRGPGPVASSSSSPMPSAAAAAGPAVAGPSLAALNVHDQGNAAAAATGASSMSLGQDLKEEYDPARPNDYEQVRKERERLRREAEAEAERQERLREMKELEELELRRQEEEPEPPPSFAGPAAAAPQPMQIDEDARRQALSLSGEEAFRRRAALSGGPSGGGMGGGMGGMGIGGGGGLGAGGGLGMGLGAGGGAGGGGLGFGGGGGGGPEGGAGQQPKGMGLAQKLLEKMGWREGEGLGKNRQGISAPLMMQKTDVRSGVIVSADGKPAGAPEAKRPKQGAVISGTPSKVVLLTNVVGPGEVDEQLEDEVGQECTKYGAVQSVTIFEVTEAGFPADQAVRIFVEFSRVEEATKCLVDMQGRFFGGRTVHACFFDEERLERSELAPKPEEVRR